MNFPKNTMAGDWKICPMTSSSPNSLKENFSFGFLRFVAECKRRSRVRVRRVACRVRSHAIFGSAKQKNKVQNIRSAQTRRPINQVLHFRRSITPLLRLLLSQRYIGTHRSVYTSSFVNIVFFRYAEKSCCCYRRRGG